MKRIFLLLMVLEGSLSLLAQGTLKLTSGASLKTGSAAYIVLNNTSLVNEGALQQSTNDGTVKFTGAADVSLSGSGITNLDHLLLAKGAGSILHLQSGLSIASEVNFAGGLLNLNNQVLNLGSTGSFTGESEASRAYTTGTGYVQANGLLNAPASYNLGNLGAVITSAANLGNVVVKRGHASQVNSFGAGSSVLRYYDILPSNNSSLNATLRFYYLDAELNGLSEALLQQWRSPNATTWSMVGFDGRDATSNYVEKAGLANLERFTLSTAGNTLPVTYILFNARCVNGTVKLTWKTGREINSSQFSIERSEDGRTWSSIGIVAASGTTTGEQSYSFSDAAAVSNALYRVAEKDQNGKISYTSVIRSACNSKEGFEVHPNPVSSEAVIRVVSEESFVMNLALYDAHGKLVASRAEKVLPGVNQYSLNMAGLPAGTYTIFASGFKGAFKVVKVAKL
jgi:hypothetical protein